MSRRAFTVLTMPILPTRARWYRRLRGLARPLVRPGVVLSRVSPYPGHYAVVRSVVEGLREIGADFNFNPERMRDLSEVVYAPANEALRQAAELKRQGRIRRLIAGPVNALVPDEANGILRLPEIDTLVVASEWVLGLYRESDPALAGKGRVAPAGVDATWWRPSVPVDRSRVVVYWKNGDARFCHDVEDILRARDLTPVRIRYGEYTVDSYRAALDGAVAAVFLSSFETQGLAVAEAWSMDVPALVWDPRGPAEWRGHAFQAGSSCPYLTAETGLAWKRLDTFDASLGQLLAARETFRPRQWVLAHMTDAVCARRLHGIIHESAG